MAGTSPDPLSNGYDMLRTTSAHHSLIKIVKKKKAKAMRNLLSGEFENEAVAAAATDTAAPDIDWVPYWQPALTVQAVEDFTAYQANGVPAQVLPSLTIDRARGKYVPVLFINEFWLMADRYILVNDTTPTLPLELTFSVTNLMR